MLLCATPELNQKESYSLPYSRALLDVDRGRDQAENSYFLTNILTSTLHKQQVLILGSFIDSH